MLRTCRKAFGVKQAKHTRGQRHLGCREGGREDFVRGSQTEGGPLLHLERFALERAGEDRAAGTDEASEKVTQDCARKPTLRCLYSVASQK